MELYLEYGDATECDPSTSEAEYIAATRKSTPTRSDSAWNYTENQSREPINTSTHKVDDTNEYGSWSDMETKAVGIPFHNPLFLPIKAA